MEMNHNQWLIVRRFKRLLRDAIKAGIRVCADSDACAIRLITIAEYEKNDSDIRKAGIALSVPDGCGSSAKVSTTGNMTIS
jgi:hypothetical protein